MDGIKWNKKKVTLENDQSGHISLNWFCPS